MTGRVYLNPKGNGRGVPKDLRTAIDSRIEIVMVHDPRMWITGDGTDIYVTRADLHHLTEAAAATIGAEIVCMPSAAEYLAKKVATITATRDCWIFQAGKRGDRP